MKTSKPRWYSITYINIILPRWYSITYINIILFSLIPSVVKHKLSSGVLNLNHHVIKMTYNLDTSIKYCMYFSNKHFRFSAFCFRHPYNFSGFYMWSFFKLQITIYMYQCLSIYLSVFSFIAHTSHKYSKKLSPIFVTLWQIVPLVFIICVVAGSLHKPHCSGTNDKQDFVDHLVCICIWDIKNQSAFA